jgi:hypothetical protein
MTTALRRFPMAVALGAVLLASCGSPPPTCSATETPYSICDEDRVWECPQATQAKLDEKKAIDAACQQQPSPTQCILDAKYELFPMTLKVDCKAGGQVCVASTPPAVRSASCKVP